MAPFRKKHEALNGIRVLPASRPEPLAVLDIGESKIACLIVRPEGVRREDQVLRIAGQGHQCSRGIRGGVVVDMDAAESAIRAAVDKAERMAGQTLSQVRLCLNAGNISSHHLSVDIDIGGHEVTDRDLMRAYHAAIAQFPTPGRSLLHALPTNYAVDGRGGVYDPRGMFAERLSIDLHLMTVPTVGLKNLRHVVERCHLDVAGITASPYAAGLSALTADEKKLGAVCVDLGGGTTGLSVFRDGTVQYADTIAVGSHHITNDIARGLSTPLAVAERLKTMKGAAVIGPRDDYEQIEFPQLGEGHNPAQSQVQSPKIYLNRIIGPRIEETLEMVAARLTAAGYTPAQCPRVVLVGGGSQLPGVREVATRILGRQTRLGRPMRLIGLIDGAEGPGFASATGGLMHGCFGPQDAVTTAGVFSQDPTRKREMPHAHLPVMKRAMAWVMENF